MRSKLKKWLVYFLASAIILPGWIIGSAFISKPATALAATSVTGGDSGGTTLNGSLNYASLAPLTITANNAGDIVVGASGIKIEITTNTGALLQFDTSSTVTADPSSDLDLGNGNGNSIHATVLAAKIDVNVATASAPAGSYVNLSGIKIHATVLGKKGSEQLKITTSGGVRYGDTISVDTQSPTVTSANIVVSGHSGLLNAFKAGDTVNVKWNNSATGDNNSDISSVTVDFSQIGGPVSVSATNSGTDVWSALYALPDNLNFSGAKFSVTASDSAGNHTSANSASFNVDTQPPVITITRAPDKDFNNSSYNFTVDFGDSVTVKEYKIDSGAWTSYAGSVNVATAGDHIFYARGTDSAGNIGSSQVNFSIGTVLPPAPSGVSVSTSRKTVTLNWSAVGGDVVGYIITIDGIPVDIGNVTSYSTELAYGDHTILVTSYDQFGNGNLNDTAGLASAQDAAKLAGLEKSFTLVTVGPVTKTSALTVAPEAAQAAETPAVTQLSETPSESGLQTEEEGQVKGEKETTQEEKINWTPWIILFVLIVLAGAATGGYFYWFSGEEEVQTVVKIKPEVEKKTTPTRGRTTTKKPRRW